MNNLTLIQRHDLTNNGFRIRVTDSCIGDLLESYWGIFNCNFCGNTVTRGILRLFLNTDRGNIGEFLR